MQPSDVQQIVQQWVNTELWPLFWSAVGIFGGVGAVIFGITVWCSKLLMNVAIEKQKASLATTLEEHKSSLNLHGQTKITELKSALEERSTANLRQLETSLDVYSKKHLKGHVDKVSTYQLAIDAIATFLADFDSAAMKATALNASDKAGKKTQLSDEELKNFNLNRLKVYGYLGAMAPQDVMNSYDQLTDYLLGVCDQTITLDWNRVRALALVLLNSIRKDIGVGEGAVEYKGSR